MYYWNQDNFEGLEDIARSLRDSADVKDFSDYCRLRAEGLRKQAFGALTRFLSQALNWEFEKRRNFVDWLLTFQYNNPQIHQLIPQPLMKKLVEPTLIEWTQYQLDSPIPHRWRGVFFREFEELERAIPRMHRLNTKLIRIMSYAILKDGENALEHQLEEERFSRLRRVVNRLTEEGITPVHENGMNYGGMPCIHTLQFVENVPAL